MHASVVTQQAAAAPTGRGVKMIARAVSVNKVPGLGTQGIPGTVSIRERPAKARAVAISMPGWLPNEEGSRKTKSKSSKSTASGVPVTKREAMFAVMGMFVGGAAVGGAILTRFDVDKEAARVALDALMEDQNFRAAVTEQVLKEELKAPAAMMATREAEVDLELVSMRKQMQDVTAMVEEMTAAAEARNAAARAANEAAAARAAAAAEKKRNSWGWFSWGSKPCL